MFSYSIGDHAMSINVLDDKQVLRVPLISHEDILEKYNVDFFSYISNLKAIRFLLIKKIVLTKRSKKELVSKIKVSKMIKLKANTSLNQLSFNIKIMEKLSQILWTTPLYSHTYHNKFGRKELNENNLKSFDSIFLEYIKVQENEWDLKFQEEDILAKLKDLRNQMASMWLPFREKHFNFALKKLNELSNLSFGNANYLSIVEELVENLIPVFSIYEIFNRSLSESVYPESIPQTKRLGAYFALFLSSKYNIFGVSLMRFFNKLSYYNWIYLVKKKSLSVPELFNLILRLPIWKHIPFKVKERILKSNIEYIK